jgi:hypothetical protein
MSPRPPISTITTLSLAALTIAATATAAVPRATSLQPGNLAAPRVISHARALERRPAASGLARPGSRHGASATRSLAARSRPDLTSQDRHGQLNVAPVVVQVTAPNAGFDWGDAAIGAAAALGLSMIALAAAVAISQRRARRTEQPPGGIT